MEMKDLSCGAIACMINGEIGIVLAVMRRNARRYLANDDSLASSFKSLRKNIFTWRQPWSEINPTLYLQPFLDVICSLETSAPITSVALSAVYNILSFEVFDLETGHVAEAMHGLVQGVTSCRFEVIDSSSEEVVLMKILQVLLAVIKHATSKLLSDKDLCLVVDSCFRVVHQAVTKGEILQRTARHSMHEIVRVLFARLPLLKVLPNCGMAPNSNADVDFDASVPMKGPHHTNGCTTSNGMVTSSEPLDEVSMSKVSVDGKRDHEQESRSEPPSSIEPYGIVGIVEIFRYLCSLLDSGMATSQDLRAIDEDVPLFALGLINSAVALGGQSFGLHTELLAIVQDDLFRSIMHLALSSKNPLILSIICSVVLNLYHHHRRHLKLQLESFFSYVIIRLSQGKYGATYQQQEVAMEFLVDFCRQPTFMPELYVNFDCDILCSNLFEDLGSLLSKNAFPVNFPLSTLHVLSLEGLIAIMHSMADRSNAAMKVPPEPFVDDAVCEYVPFWTLKCNNYEDSKCWVEFVQRQKSIKHKLMIGVEHFNKDLNKGFEYLQRIHLLPEKLDPSSVAHFFRSTTGLDKSILGDFLGDPDEFALKVLEEFVREFDFQGMSLDAAMRVFLETFRLPGEAQKIHRIMEAFAAQYHKQSPQVLADEDAAFLLAYSLILLNTDQHNSQVKKKMSEEDFIRNNRSINGGQDLPRDYLSDLYHSIVRNEIKMSYESGTGMAEMASSRWVSLIYKSKKVSPYIICDVRPFLDHEMFAIISGPTVAAICVVFDHAEDEEVLRVCEDGFLTVAKVLSSYHSVEVLDDLVISLCNFTTLLNPVGTMEELLISFTDDIKACTAATIVFKIANSYGDHLRTSWCNIVDCIVQLHKLGLLPPRVLNIAADEMDARGGEAVAGRSAVLGAVSAGNKKRASGLIGRFSQLLYLESEELNIQPTEEQVAAHQRITSAIEACRIDSIISESKFLQAESLLQLAKALIFVAGRSQKVGSSFEDEATAVFCLDLLIAVVLHNRDRILLLWHGVYKHMSHIVQTAAVPCLLVEKAVFGLLRICQRLLPYKEELGEELLRSLQVILKLDARVADTMCERITQEVMQLVKANARHIKSAMSWRTVSSLLSITARHLEASEVGFEALSFIMLEGVHLTRENYVLFLDAARAFAAASTGGVDRSVRALDLMSGSTKCLIKWSDNSMQKSSVLEAKEAEELGEMWLRLVQGLRKLVVDPREQVRNFAIFSLQGTLSAAESMHLPALLLGQVFDQVLLVMLNDLLEIAVRQSPKEFRNMETTLYLAMKLVSKVFLQFLEQLSSLPSFPSVWSAVLNHMGRYMKTRIRGDQGSDKLQECIPELLKNMLLVMKARGVEGSTLDGYTLWELTRHYVRGIVPSLEQELFSQEATKAEPVLVEALAST